ncbi:MAG: polysaccharide biosynthesis tyrosine autokinase [Acidobacteria bacterium]|nr:polysaccharide biosynthesis tyrosine autokinase [Acidobacteriota bacterium]
MAHLPNAGRGRQGTHRSSWHPSDHLRVLYKRRWVAIPGFLLVFLSGAIGSIRTVPIYEARTQIMIEKDARRATSLNTVMEERESWYQDDFYPTQYRVLQSRTLATRTAEALGTAKPERVPADSGLSFSLSGLVSSAVAAVAGWFGPEPLAVSPGDSPTSPESARLAALTDRVQGGVAVVPVRSSRLVDLKFRSPDPEFAARVVNLHAAQYIEQSLEFRVEATTQTNAWLNTQLEQQRLLVEESERRLQEYKEQNNATSVDEKQNIVVQKLNALNDQVVQARIERMNLEVQVNAVAERQARGESLESFPAVLASPVVQKLRADIVARESERARLGTQYGPAYPAMRDLASQIATANRDLALEIEKVVSGIRAEFQTARAREQALQQSLDSQQRESLGLDRKMLDYAALEREAQSNRQLYENLLTRAKETGAAGEYRGTSIQVLDRAEVPVAPVLPRTQRDLMLAALGGLLLAFGLAFGFEYFDSRIKLPEEIKTHLGLPFLGMIPSFGGGDKDGEAPLLQAEAPAAFSEAIRAVRTAVLFSSAEEGARSVVVTSTGPHEGKTVVSSSLAITLAQAGQRTIVVDADMRRPRMHEALGRSQEPGLSNVLVGEATLADATRATSVPNLTLLAAGHIPPNPVELLCSPRYVELIAELKRRYDWVVIDAPPVMPVTDAAVVANNSSGVIFVVGAEMTPRQSAAAAVEQLRGANAKFIGAVLNRVNLQRHSYYYSPYYRKSYGKYYQRSANRA